jgi:hypothetical protein
MYRKSLQVCVTSSCALHTRTSGPSWDHLHHLDHRTPSPCVHTSICWERGEKESCRRCAIVELHVSHRSSFDWPNIHRVCIGHLAPTTTHVRAASSLLGSSAMCMHTFFVSVEGRRLESPLVTVWWDKSELRFPSHSPHCSFPHKLAGWQRKRVTRLDPTWPSRPYLHPPSGQ